MSSSYISLIAPRKVRVSKDGVRLFNNRWPCSELDARRAYWFEFDESQDLVDTDVPEHSDGGAAIAMSQDCQRWLFDNELPEWL